MARLPRSAMAAALALLPTAAWATTPDLRSRPGTASLWLAADKHGGDKHGGAGAYRSACVDEARSHGWHVLHAGEQTYSNGPNGGTWHVPMRVRDRRHTFDALCEARGDGSFVGVKRRD